MKNLENFGVQELNTEEIKNTNGGLMELLKGLLLGLVLEIAANPSSHWEAFKEGVRAAN